MIGSSNTRVISPLSRSNSNVITKAPVESVIKVRA